MLVNVHYHLQPIAKEIPSYVQDTRDFLRKLEGIETVPDNFAGTYLELLWAYCFTRIEINCF